MPPVLDTRSRSRNVRSGNVPCQRGTPCRHAHARDVNLAFNFFLLVAGEMTAKVLTFASLTYLARTLGPTDYGFIEFTLAVMVFFSLPADLGLGVLRRP